MTNNEEIIDLPNHLTEHDYFQPLVYDNDHNKVHEENVEVMAFEEEENEIGVAGVSETYCLIPDVHNKSRIYVDNLGFKYYKREVRGVHVYLVCEQQNKSCHCTAIVNTDSRDNKIHLQINHNHQPKENDLNLHFLRDAIDEALIDSVTASLKRCLCDNEIINHPTTTQVKRMRLQPTLEIGQLSDALNEYS